MDPGYEAELMKSKYVKKIMNELNLSAFPFKGQIEFLDPLFISMFLKVCKNDLEKTKEKIIDYYTLKKQHPKLMKVADFLDERILAIVNQGIVVTDIDQSHSESPIVLTISFRRVQGRLDLYEGANLLINGSIHALLDSARAQKHGGIVVFDMGNLPYHILFQFTPVFLQKCVWGDSLQQVHMINVGMIIMATINAIRLLIPNHLNNILYVHGGSWECLNDFIPAENLPEEYGGTNGTVEQCNDALIRVLLKWREFMLKNDNLHTSTI